MKSVVLYSTYVPDVSKLDIAINILNEILAYFSDDKIIIGNSSKSIALWETVVFEYKKKGYDIIFSTNIDKYLIDSDVTGFQQCLFELSFEKIDYDLVWFVHTKGITNDKRAAVRNLLIQELIREKFAIESYFAKHDKLGSYGFYITKDPEPNRVTNNLKKIIEGGHAEGIFYPHTWYVLKGEIINNFIASVNKDFFDSNLLQLGFDRYFFERDFTGIVQMMDYQMGYKAWKQHRYLGSSKEALQNSILL